MLNCHLSESKGRISLFSVLSLIIIIEQSRCKKWLIEEFMKGLMRLKRQLFQHTCFIQIGPCVRVSSYFPPSSLVPPSFHWTHGYLEWGLYSPISLAAKCHQVWTGKRQAKVFCSSFWESSLKDSWCRPFTPSSSSFLLPATYNVHTHTLAGSPKAVMYYE